jgi:hypothetical protein
VMVSVKHKHNKVSPEGITVCQSLHWMLGLSGSYWKAMCRVHLYCVKSLLESCQRHSSDAMEFKYQWFLFYI